VRVPAQEAINRDVLLRCSFDLHPPAVLYSVKWYKDGSEFYRYLPAETPPTQAFTLPGVTVNVSPSVSILIPILHYFSARFAQKVMSGQV
jgi:hypothetical protein